MDIARKPDVVEPMIAASVEQCPREKGDSEALYATRLREVLMAARTKNLETLRDNKLVVCLDMRQAFQKTGLFDEEVEGALYKQEGIVAVFDNGKTDAQAGWLRKSPSDYSGGILNDLGKQVRDGLLNRDAKVFFGYTYTSSCGKGCTSRHYNWKSQNKFDQDTLAKNPQLLVAPVLRYAPKPDWGG